MKMKHLGTSLLGGADGAEDGCTQTPAAGVSVLGLWGPIPPTNLHTKLQDFQSRKRSGGRSLRSAWAGHLPRFLALFCHEDGEGCLGGRGLRRGWQGPYAWRSALAQQDCPETPWTSEPSFLGIFHPDLLRRECGASSSSQSFKNAPYKLGILALYLWYKLWIFPSSVSFVLWACLWWPFFPTQIFIFYFYVVKCTDLSLYSIWTSAIF